MADTTGRIPFVTSAVQFIRDLGQTASPLVASIGKYTGLYAPAVWAGDNYQAANDKQIREATTLDALFSDDFGGAALDTAIKWDYFNGGLPLNPTIDGHQLLQAAIGSGINGTGYAVANSKLTITQPVTPGAEQLFLSQQTFAGKEDILVLFKKALNTANLSVFVGLVEVDPTTGVPLLNPNIAADGNGASEFTNRGGVELANTFGDFVSFRAEAIGDSSPSIALGNTGTSAVTSVPQEFFVEIDNHDIIVSASSPDAIAGKLSTASRVSTQCPNDNKLYKLAIRVRNIGGVAPGCTIELQRILVSAHFENRVQITGGEGDQQPQKAIAAYIVNSLTAVLGAGAAVIGAVTQSGNWVLSAGAAVIGAVTQSGAWTFAFAPVATSGPTLTHKLSSAATTNATSVKATAANISGGCLDNTTAAYKYFKLYQKATAPTVGTDTPSMTIALPPNSKTLLGALFGPAGYRMTTGLAYAITGAYADADTTAVAAGDVLVQLLYT